MARATMHALGDALRDSLHALATPADDIDQLIHQVRKNNKKARAMCWMLEPWVDGESWARVRDVLRDSSRLLAGPRRSAALLGTLSKLSEDEGQVSPAIQERLASDRELPGELKGEVRRLLAFALEEIHEWHSAGAPDEAVLSRFRKSRRRTKRRTRRAMRQTSIKRLHAARQEIKRHLALEQTLSPLLEERSSSTSRNGGRADSARLDELADQLGKVNDLEDLRHVVQGAKKEIADPAELKPLRRRVREQRQREIKKSVKLARSIFSKKARGAEPESSG
jgi:hypothetical protein